MNTQEQLDFFMSALSTDANTLSSQILESVQSESKAALSAAEDEYLSETYRYIKNEVGRIRTEIRRTVSHKTLENKSKIYALRKGMYDEVNKAVTAKLAAYTQTPAYRQKLIHSLREIADGFGHEAIQVFLRPADMALAPALQAALPDVELSFFEGGFKLGGLLCQCDARHWQVDDTFDTRYTEMETRFNTLLGTVSEK